MIAKYVKVYFKGQFSISGLGDFVFDNGRVKVPVNSGQQLVDIANKINMEIAQLV